MIFLKQNRILSFLFFKLYGRSHISPVWWSSCLFPDEIKRLSLGFKKLHYLVSDRCLNIFPPSQYTQHTLPPIISKQFDISGTECASSCVFPSWKASTNTSVLKQTPPLWEALLPVWASLKAYTQLLVLTTF